MVSIQKHFLDLLHIQCTFIWRAWTFAVMICGSCQEPNFSHCVPGYSSFVHLANTAAELECHHRGQLANAPPLVSALPQPSLLYNCQLTTTDTDGEQKHRTGKGRQPPTGVRKQEDSTHTVQERILPDNIINSFILNIFFIFIFSFFLLFKMIFIFYLFFF